MDLGSTPSADLEPHATRVRSWMGQFTRALKGQRVYAENNETLHRYLADASEQLTELLEEIPELSLTVREDRLLFAKDPVLIDTDRLEGLPFLLYRNAFRRLTFLRGMGADELAALLKAITADYTTADVASEDLVTALWRLQLPHLRYVTIDTLSTDPKRVSDPEERQEIERLQVDVETLIAALYRQSATGEDLVSGISITKEDLEALKQIREEPEEEVESLDQQTSRWVVDVPPDELAAFRGAVEAESHEGLIRNTMDVLVRMLFKEQSSQDAMGALQLLQQLLDSMLMGQRFAHATELVRRLNVAAQDMDDLQQMHVARQLLMLFAAPKRLVPVLAGLNDRTASRAVGELVGFIRLLGRPTVPALLAALGQIDAPAHRRVVRDLILELGVPDEKALESRMEDAEWFVVRDLLQLAEQLPAEQVCRLVHRGLHHGHPMVRAQGVKMLRRYAPGMADNLLVARFDDPDAEVRRSAVRVAVSRRSEAARAAIERKLQPERLAELDPREQRLWTTAYATLLGPQAVGLLAKLLPSGLFDSLKSSDVPVAAAQGLALIPIEGSVAALHKGTRSLVPKVREACRRALERIKRTDGEPETTTDDLDVSTGDFEALEGSTKPPFSLENLPAEPPPVPQGAAFATPPSGTSFHQVVSSTETMPSLDLSSDLTLIDEMPAPFDPEGTPT